jgi:murein DD-endopeptidase MepM/ murein hydrolase activator NlpD
MMFMRGLRTLILSGLLALAIGFGSPIGLAPAAAQASDQIVYIVQPGDTLPSIALRYGITTTALATANGLINPNLIYVGQPLVIPVATAATTTTPSFTATQTITATPSTPRAKSNSIANRLHIVQADETLFGLALKYGTTVQSFIDTNQLSTAGFIVTGQLLIIPLTARSNEAGIAQPRTPLPAPFTGLDFGSLPLQQGSLMEITVRTTHPVSLTGTFGVWDIPFAQDGDHYIGLVGVGAHPVSGVTPGLHNVVITATRANALPTVLSSNVQIAPGHYNSEYIRLSADRQALLDPTLVAAEREKLNATWSVFNSTRYWNGLFSVPVEKFIKISSPIGTRRSYDGGPFSSYHEGTDFAIPAGTPVYAPADGVVMVAEPLAVRGNGVVIDHGWGVYTGLYHLSEIKVTPGQAVKQGDLIGLSGNTGLSTGAHLHWDIRIRGLNVDAMQLTRQVFP